MKFLFTVLFLSPLFAQLTPENTPLQETGGLPGLYSRECLKLGSANDVIYSMTDPSRYKEFYEAVVQGYKAARRAHTTPKGKVLWTWLPNLAKDYRDNVDLVASDPFFKEIIELNQALYKAAKIEDLHERRQALHRIYDRAPAYTPTLIMVVDTEWALGNADMADSLMYDLNQWESSGGYWPLQIMNARWARRIEGIDTALQLLEDDNTLDKLKVNPIKDLVKAWRKEIILAPDQAALFKMGAVKALISRAPYNSEAAYYLARHYLEKKDMKKARNYLEMIPKDAQTLDTFTLGALIEIAKKGPASNRPLGKKTLAKVRTYLASNPDHPKLHMLSAYDKKASIDDRRKAMLKAVQLDPADDDVYAAANDLFTRLGDDESLLQVVQARIKAKPGVDLELLYLQLLVKTGAQELALDQIHNFLERYPDQHDFYIAATPLFLNLTGQDLLKGHFSATMLNLIDQRIQTGEFDDAETLANQLVRLYPDRKELNVLQANIKLVRGSYGDALALYKLALTQYPNLAALHELSGDAYLSMDQNKKAIEAYQEAVTINPESKERLAAKLEYAEGRQKKLRFTIFTGYTFQTQGFVKGPAGSFRLHWKPWRLGRPLSAISGGAWWGGNGVTGQAITETSQILTPFYMDLLDQDTAWQDQQKKG